jgi:hypothetical protein
MYVSETARAAGDRSRRVPATVLVSVAGLGLETVIFVLGVVEMFVSAHDRTSHGQSGAGTYVVAGLFLVPFAAGWGACAVMAALRVPWVRVLAVSLQALFACGTLITLLVAVVRQDVIGLVVTAVLMAVTAAVAGPLLTPGARAWFGR